MTEKIIWDCLKAQGLSDYGTAGLMGNLKAESGPNPTNLQNSFERKLGYTDASYTAAVDNGTYTNFVHDGAGYGLAQWTYWSRKQGLLDYARTAGKSIGDTKMQAGYLVFELKKYGLWEALMAATSVREASHIIMLRYEKPASIYTADREKSLEKRAGFGQEYYQKFAGRPADGKGDDGGMMTAKTLCDKVVDIAQNYKTLYVMGCFGAPMTPKNKARYIASKAADGYNGRHERTKMINAATADTFGFDCVNLIKGILWGWGGDASKQYGGSKYAANGVPDVSADGMIAKCKNVTKDFRGIVPGAAVWCKGHIGIYIGNGLAVECTPRWKNCVQITAVGNVGKVAGYNTRTWTKWGLMPYVDYTDAENGKEEDDMTKAEVLQIIKEYEAQRDAARAQAGPSDWSKAARAWAERNGIISGTGAGMQYKATCTREQVVQLLYRAAHLLERK